ncbi:MAG: alpha/beta hydrolase [Flaviaesturariibacter sp.]|nr:alpha/beta hydrolase [Flaviaesturariibacter sp.]
MKQLWTVLFLTALFSACGKRDLNDSWNPALLPAETLKDVAYGTDAKQKMDVYLPAGRNVDSTKVLVMIHGGAWIEGDKADFQAYVDTMKKRLPGYAIFNINYRLAALPTTNPFPTQEMDVKTAINAIFQKKMDYRISDKWVLLGASAGGHLALLQGYKYAAPLKPKAIVSFFGPTDMAGMYAAQTLPMNILGMQLLMGGTPASNPSSYQQSSPINYAGGQSAPTLILQGGADPIVPVAQSTSLRDKLLIASASVEYVFYPTEGHGWAGANLTHSFDKVSAFLKANVK